VQGEAFAGLLIFDFTVFVLTIARSIKLWTHSDKEPFLKRLFIDGALMSYRIFVVLISRDHLGFLYYRYPATQLFWEVPFADRLCSVICNVNLVNVIVLFVRHFLPALSPIALSPFFSVPPPGDKCKPLSNISNFVNTNQNASPISIFRPPSSQMCM
jgi:hypothetical protein